MFANVRLVDPHTRDAIPALVVPEAAVVRRGEATLVFVPLPGAGAEAPDAGSRFTARPVELGRREAGWVEVASGLEVGDEVVTDGAFYLESELAREELGGGHGH
jgi:cobalt-zinc-cadmium efflux system membrane fusion protein